jgi:hypothetical protein
MMSVMSAPNERTSDLRSRTGHQWQPAAPGIWSGRAAAVIARLRDLAPYAAFVVMPGGSLLALLWWLYRRQKRALGQA